MTGSTVVRKALASVSALLAVTVGFVAGFALAEARQGDDPAYRLAAGLDSGWSCERLRHWYVEHGLDAVTAWGWQSPIYAEALPVLGRVDAPAASAHPLDTHTGSATGTNVQEADVDEPDIAKVSGDLLVRIADGALKTDDLSGSVPRRLGVAPLDPIGDPQLLVSVDRAVVIGSEVDAPAARTPQMMSTPRTWVRTYDLSDPTDPTLVDSRLYDGSLVAARQVGSVVRLVLDAGLPALPFTQPSTTVTEAEALAHNRQVVRGSTITDWLPRVTASADRVESSHQLVACDEVSVPESFNGLGTVTIAGFDPADPGAVDASSVTTGSDTAYMSSTHLYVATSPWSHLSQGWGPIAVDGDQPTRIYGFDLSGTSARFVGMGTVDGTVAGSWSMDEHDGVLRVAVSSFGGLAGRSVTSVVTMRPADGRLLDVGHLEGLGPGQQLKSVRWFDDVAVLVTFQQIDPFYVVDLTDPTDPRVLGELHLPGWSSYLHPVGSHLVLGLGQTSPRGIVVEPPQPMPLQPVPPSDSPLPFPRKPIPSLPLPSTPEPGASGTLPPDSPVTTGSPGGSDTSGTSGTSVGASGPGATVTISPEPVDPPWSPPVVRERAKATLFDITDPAHPRHVDTVAYPAGSVSMAGMQPHQVTWLPDRQTLLTVIASGFAGAPYATGRAWVSVLTMHDGGLDSRLLPVPEGASVDDVRTVPLTDGRVVLVAGDEVEFVTV